jgi:Tol biopolymer transport system component
MTQAGMILGTAAYMSPEQARGKTVDKRADIWAFGAVLFEMLTGKRAFPSEDLTDTLAAVVRAEPDWMLLPLGLSSTLVTHLGRCLHKDPKQRIPDIGVMRLALEGAFDVPREGTGGVMRTASARSATFAWALAGVAVTAAAVLGAAYLRRAEPEQAVIRTMIPPPTNTSFDFDVTVGPAVISPDGRLVAFSARSSDGRTQQLWVRALDSLEARALEGTNGATFPFWSPDSRSLGFVSTGRLQRVNVAGGAPVVIARTGFARGASWGRDGTIVFNQGGVIVAVSSAGGEPRPVTTRGSAAGVAGHRSPWMLPDGRHFLYLDRGPNQIRVGSLDGGEGQVVAEATSNAIYASGKLLFMREGTLLAQAFDASNRALFGNPVAVASGVQMVVGESRGVFSASETGTLLYQDGGTEAAMSLAWFDRDGARQTTVGEMGSAEGVFLSPDDRFAAVRITDAEQITDLWRVDLSSGHISRLTSETALSEISRFAVWSPDGRHVVYGARRNGKGVLARRLAVGAGLEDILFETPPEQNQDLSRATAWSRNGMSVVYSASGGIYTLPLTATGSGAPLTAKALVHDPSAQNPRLSPDDRWVTYQGSIGRATSGIFVEAFPSGGQRQRVADNGSLPVWSPDGKALYYAVDGVLSVVDVSELGGALRFGAPRALMPIITGRGFSYDVAKDGRILALVTSERRASRPLTLVQNWIAALKGD